MPGKLAAFTICFNCFYYLNFSTFFKNLLSFFKDYISEVNMLFLSPKPYLPNCILLTQIKINVLFMNIKELPKTFPAPNNIFPIYLYQCISSSNHRPIISFHSINSVFIHALSIDREVYHSDSTVKWALLLHPLHLPKVFFFVHLIKETFCRKIWFLRFHMLLSNFLVCL